MPTIVCLETTSSGFDSVYTEQNNFHMLYYEVTTKNKQIYNKIFINKDTYNASSFKSRKMGFGFICLQDSSVKVMHIHKT